MTKPGPIMQHCGKDVVESHQSVRSIKKRNREPQTTEITLKHPVRKKQKVMPVSKILEFTRKTVKEGTASETVGKGLLLTEQVLLEADSGGLHHTPLAFSAVDRDGKIDDDKTKEDLAKVFANFAPVLMPTAKTGNKSAPMSPKNVLKHFMSVDKRAMLLCLVALATCNGAHRYRGIC